jgi:hypothetical protein
MSNRILSCQKEQLVWECKAGKQYMNGPVKVQQLQTNRTWEQCIEQYTHRSLTFPDDRLMAISGYAKLKHREYQLRGGTSSLNRYLAGLWEVYLVDHMLWIFKIKPPPSRPTFYRSPTWSWAPINGPIEYVSDDRKGYKGFTIKLIFVSLSTNPLNPFGTLLQSPAQLFTSEGLPQGCTWDRDPVQRCAFTSTQEVSTDTCKILVDRVRYYRCQATNYSSGR